MRNKKLLSSKITNAFVSLCLFGVVSCTQNNPSPSQETEPVSETSEAPESETTENTVSQKVSVEKIVYDKGVLKESKTEKIDIIDNTELTIIENALKEHNITDEPLIRYKIDVHHNFDGDWADDTTTYYRNGLLVWKTYIIKYEGINELYNTNGKLYMSKWESEEGEEVSFYDDNGKVTKTVFYNSDGEEEQREQITDEE